MRRGEFEVSWRGGPPIFVEVKAPDWQGELSTHEKTGARKAQGKHVNLEGRWTDPLEQPLSVMEKNAIPKLTPDRPNLIVIADDLFISPVGAPHLEGRMRSFLARPESACVGGVLFFKAECHRGEIEYTIRFHENPGASGPAGCLPQWPVGWRQVRWQTRNVASGVMLVDPISCPDVPPVRRRPTGRRAPLPAGLPR